MEIISLDFHAKLEKFSNRERETKKMRELRKALNH